MHVQYFNFTDQNPRQIIPCVSEEHGEKEIFTLLGQLDHYYNINTIISRQKLRIHTRLH